MAKIQKQPKYPSNWWKDKQIVVYPYNGKLLTNKKERTTDIFDDMDESQMYYAKWEKTQKTA